jgi:hypothetical protein
MAFEGEDARRWSMTDAPTMLPGVDFITRSPVGPFIDTGINTTVETKGHVYLSVETIREMAEIAGLLENKNAQERSLHDLEMYNAGYETGLKEGQEISERLVAISNRLGAQHGSNSSAGAVVTKAAKKPASVSAGKPESDPLDI